MDRRRFLLTSLGGALPAPLAARAQQASRLPTIGLLGSGTAAAQSQWTAAFVQRLRDLGWTEGRNIAIEYRWAEGRSERFAEIAAEFVRLKVDVILTHNTPPPLAAKRATSVIPIVFATAGDPVASGLVSSLARPGGNVTGLSSQAPDAAGKRVELLREVVPGLMRKWHGGGWTATFHRDLILSSDGAGRGPTPWTAVHDAAWEAVKRPGIRSAA
jgi:putative ABC transport system substrate-binding protein